MIPRVYVPEKIYFEPGSYVRLKQKKYWREDKKTGEMVQVVYDLDTHPWGECDAVLARVIGCYSNYISCTIFPHMNPNGMTTEYTKPYNQSIHKHDIFLGNTIVEPVKLTMPSGK